MNRNKIRTIKDLLANRILTKEAQLRLNTHLEYKKNQFFFESAADPYKVIWIDPKNVEYYSIGIQFSRTLGEVRDGDWDKMKQLEPIEEEFIVKGLKQRFEDGKEWRQTEYVNFIQTNYFDNGKSKWGCENIDELIEKRCSYVDQIFKDIKHNGYTPEMEGGENNTYSDKSKYKQNLEPLVAIGRNGSIIWEDGFHRYAISEILNINIPVQIAFRHKKWQLYRDKIRSSTELSQIGKSSHPDLNDVV